MKKKVTIVFDDHEELEKFAKRRGLRSVANLARVAVAEYRAVHASEEAPLREGRIELRLENADELHAYAREKGLRNIPALAEFCINRYMAQYPPKHGSGVPPATSNGRKTKVAETTGVSK